MYRQVALELTPATLDASCPITTQTPSSSSALLSTLDHYQELAADVISGAKSPTARNLAITGAYAALFLHAPDAYFWPGMAAYASAQVGSGIRVTGVDFTRSDFSLEDIEKLNGLLIAGNDAVYHDLFPLFLAFEDGGMAIIQNLPIDPTLKGGFDLIDRGRVARKSSDTTLAEELLWQGNKILLHYEQAVTLQNTVYSQVPELWRKVSALMFMRFDQGVLSSPRHWTRFWDHVPSGNIANVDDRWAWITSSMLPIWKNRVNKEPTPLHHDMMIFKNHGRRAKDGEYPF